ncbi:MAG: 23S rRNA (pseudouridine(1915)-N(3))-methyltransferase RlmH [Clostridia bacterium]|nr:23S rRNA (pseudouridine(1915)-N(3))-methyltransferase RlmH [Clostridia bacterium]
MGVKIVCVGNLKEKYLKDAAAEYVKRLSRFCDLEITETPESTPAKEKDAILKNIKGKTVALCVEGERMSSEKLAEFIEKTAQSSPKITFVIGGSDGLDGEVKSRADLKLSFSEMTFPHQLMRIILLEQIYRAFTIINNIKYHK